MSLPVGQPSEALAAGEPEAMRSALAIYTAGYEGQTIESFLDKMVRNGIRLLVDVRRNPISRKRGFSKRQLSESAARVGISYEHLPDLGIPSDERRHLDSPMDYRRLFSKYEKAILPAAEESVDRVVTMVSVTPAVLVCFEADWHRCHRSRLANAVASRIQLEVVHL